MKYCPYSDAILADTELNDEHILPKSIGGADKFVIPVSAKVNSDLGSRVDGAFESQSFIKGMRVWFGLMGHSRTEPELVLNVQVPTPIVGEVEVEITIQKNSISYRVPIQHHKVGSDRLYFASSDAKEAAGCVERMKQKKIACGNHVTVLEPNLLELSVPQLFTVGGNEPTCRNFMAKVAIATFFYAFEIRSGSEPIHELRSLFMQPNRLPDTTKDLIEMGVCRTQDHLFLIEQIFPNCHTVWIASSECGTYAFISVFGILTAKVFLTNIYLPTRIFTVDYLSRSLKEHQIPLEKCAILGITCSPDFLYSELFEGSWFRPVLANAHRAKLQQLNIFCRKVVI